MGKLGQVEFDRRPIRSTIGRIGEVVVQQFLRKNGYEAHEFLRISNILFGQYGEGLKRDYELFKTDSKRARDLYRSIHYTAPTENFDKELWDGFFSKKENLEAYKRYRAGIIETYDEVKKFAAFLGNELKNFERYAKEPRPYTPDIVAKKDNKIYLVEVKANAGVRQLRELKAGAMIAKKHGFVPILATLKVSVRASDLVMKELVV